MAIIGLAKLRQQLDEAITYADISVAKRLIAEGLSIAQDKELLGEIMYFKAQGEIVEENYYNAISYLDLAIKYNSHDGAAYNDRALCMVELDMKQEALWYFDKGIEMEPDYATIYHNKGWLLNKIGQHEQALPILEKALVLEPNRAVTYENIADVYVNLGKTQEAISAYRKAAQLLETSYPIIKEQIDAKIEMLTKDNI